MLIIYIIAILKIRKFFILNVYYKKQNISFNFKFKIKNQGKQFYHFTSFYSRKEMAVLLRS